MYLSAINALAYLATVVYETIQSTTCKAIASTKADMRFSMKRTSLFTHGGVWDNPIYNMQGYSFNQGWYVFQHETHQLI